MERGDRHDYPSVEVQYTKDDYVAGYQLATSFTRRGWLIVILSILLICIAAFFFFRYDGAPLRLQLLVPGLYRARLCCLWISGTGTRRPVARPPCLCQAAPRVGPRKNRTPPGRIAVSSPTRRKHHLVAGFDQMACQQENYFTLHVPKPKRVLAHPGSPRRSRLPNG